MEDPILALLCLTHEQRRLVLSHYVHKTGMSLSGSSKQNYVNSVQRVLWLAEALLKIKSFFGNWSVTNSDYEKFQLTLKKTTIANEVTKTEEESHGPNYANELEPEEFKFLIHLEFGSGVP